MLGRWGMTESNSRNQRAAHRRFWAAEDRLAKLIPAARKILDDVEETISDVREEAGFWHTKSQDRTFRRYIDRGHTPTRPNHEIYTGLCCGLANIVKKYGDELPGTLTDEALTILGLRKELPKDLTKRPKPNMPKRGMYSRAELEAILAAIPVPFTPESRGRPEFPPNSPRFPASPIIEIANQGFRLLIKDESVNPTGSHKDRWAWEKLLQYKRDIGELIAKAEHDSTLIEVPPRSIISAGSAAYALQSLLRAYGLPPLRAVMDTNELRVPPQVVQKLEAIGTKVYRQDLSKFLSSSAVLKITKNRKGTDITTRNYEAPFKEKFYDWLICEVLELAPTHIFVPFGSGDLFINFISFLKRQKEGAVKDDRLKFAPDNMDGIHVLGAAAENERTRMHKLYTSHKPDRSKLEEELALLKDQRILGAESGIYEIEDQVVERARGEAPIRESVNAELSGLAGLGLLRKREGELKLDENSLVVVVNTGWQFVSWDLVD